MVTLLATMIIDFLDSYFNQTGQLMTLLTNIFSYLANSQWFSTFLGIIYFFIGKDLLSYMLGGAIVIFGLRLLFAVINLVGQYVP